MIQTVYGILLIISMMYLLIMLTVYRKHTSVFYVLLCVAMININLGNYLISKATTVEAAVFGNQVIYMGSCFIPLFLVLCIAELCNVRIPSLIVAGFAATGMFILVCVLNQSIDWYYTGFELVTKNGAVQLIKSYGPLHKLNYIYLIALIVLGFAIVVYSYRNKRDASHYTSAVCLAILTITVGIYALQRAMNAVVEWTCLAYVIDFLLVLIILRRIKLYDLAGFSGMTMESSNEYGFVICDAKRRFAGADGFARKSFVELNDLEIDKVVTAFDTDFLAKLQGWMSGQEKDTLYYFRRGDKYIEARYSLIKESGGQIAHCVRLHDDTKHQEYKRLIENYNENLENEVARQTRKLRRVQDDIIISMASIVENRDNNTGGHIQRTSDIMRIFVEHLMDKKYPDALTGEIAGCIIKAAPLHDFGKIAIPDEILNKPGKFTPEEYEVMKQHSAKGATIVARILQHSEDVQFKNIAVNVAHYHHEKWDGTGYPEGLMEKEIPFEARVMALADVFDALVSKRVYKEQMSYEKAFGIIEESSGKHFDPMLCSLFLECRPKLEALYDNYEDDL